MCLQAVENYVQPGMTVLDVGTGSGILAIAAGKLGAAGVLAIDNDPQAVSAAEANVAANELDGRITVRLGVLDDLPVGHHDLVIVNILAPVIIELLHSGRLLAFVAPEGRLILSGIIDTQQPGVESTVLESGGHVESVLTVRDWTTLICRR
jgi:ribosomal protein L11 methyltransferase